MDLTTFRQALICCGVNQALARNSIIAQGYNNMEVFTHYLANDRSIVDFVKSVNKLPANQDGEWPSIPFASIRLLQAMRHWTIERQRCGLAIAHNELTHEEFRADSRAYGGGGKHRRDETRSASFTRQV